MDIQSPIFLFNKKIAYLYAQFIPEEQTSIRYLKARSRFPEIFANKDFDPPSPCVV